MRNTIPHWIAIGVLGAALLVVAFKFVILGNTREGSAEDPRTVVVLSESERTMVLGEMRLLLESVQAIIDALTRNDLKTVEVAARKVGMAAVSTMDLQLRAKLPLEFKSLGFGTHGAFDEIADMAASGRSAREIQKKLADTMNNCVACHATYRLATEQ